MMSVHFLLLIVLVSRLGIRAKPVSKDDETSTGNVACNDSDEIISHDPCKPLCVCKNSKLYCADIICSVENLPLEGCLKLPVNGKCCPGYVCEMGNSTGEVHYPLPVLMIPPELSLTDMPSSKTDILHKARQNKT